MDKRVKISALAVAGLLLTLAGHAPATAGKAEMAFTVANYPVDAVDTNAVAAKEKALADGQDAAFRSLLKRIVPVTAYKQLSRVKDIKAANMVSGVAVRSEQTSSTQYIASLDFSFQADAVRSELQSRGIPFVEVQAPQVTVIPVTLAAGVPKADTGSWKNGWAGLDLEHTLTPVKLETLKAEIHPDTVKMLLAGDDNGHRILAGEYKTETIVLAIAEADPAAKKFNVTLVGLDAAGPITLKRSYRMSDGDLNYASELAAIVSLGILEGRWKAEKSPADGVAAAAAQPEVASPQWGRAAATAGGDTIRFTAEFASLAQWNEMRTQLLDTPGVEDIDIASVSSLNADVSLTFPGGTGALANALGARGLSLSADGPGWKLRAVR